MNGELYGLIAEFNSPEELLRAASAARAHGFRRMDAYSPFPLDGLTEALGKRHTFVPFLVLLGGAFGCALGFVMQWFANVIHYRINSGGRPPNSWPAFIPITFELTVLFAGFTALFSVIFLNRQPQLYHPVFNAANFERASIDKFFLCIEATDVKFDPVKTAEWLKQAGATTVVEVPH